MIRLLTAMPHLPLRGPGSDGRCEAKGWRPAGARSHLVVRAVLRDGVEGRQLGVVVPALFLGVDDESDDGLNLSHPGFEGHGLCSDVQAMTMPSRR